MSIEKYTCELCGYEGDIAYHVLVTCQAGQISKLTEHLSVLKCLIGQMMAPHDYASVLEHNNVLKDRITDLEVYESQLENEVDYWSQLQKTGAERVSKLEQEVESWHRICKGSLEDTQARLGAEANEANWRKSVEGYAFENAKLRAALEKIYDGCEAPKTVAWLVLQTARDEGDK